MDPTPDALCLGCFTDLGGTHPCPHCGYDERAARPPLLLPQRALLNGQFVAGRVLGKPGGFGITYLAWDLGLHRRVAIKEYLPRELAGRGTDRATVAPHSHEDGEAFRYGLGQFLAEARTLAQLDHPNIVRVHQVFEAHGTAYLAMEFYAGLTLADYLDRKGGRLPEAEALALMQPILDGLRAVHAKGFLHRDIKPQNIYLARLDGGGVRPILLDFGAARQAMGERSRSLSVVLTEGYAPFEQYTRKGRQGTWTDVYAAGAVLYRMVTGQIPPAANDRMTEDDLAPASTYGASATLSRTLAAALAVTSEGRLRDVAALQAALWPASPKPPEPSKQPAPPKPAVPTEPPPPAAPARSRWWGPVVLGGGLIALILGLAYLGYQDQEGRSHQDADTRAFDTARSADTEVAYRAYLSACTADGCGHQAPAEQRLGELAAAAAQAAEAARFQEAARAEQAATAAQAAEAARAAEAATRLAQERAAQEAARPAKTPIPTMVAIPAGSFSMGCQPGEKECTTDEKPAHRVQVAAFELGQTEVTFDQWDACVAAGGCTQRPGDAGWGRGQRPVINVSWDDAQQYLTWLGRQTGQTWRLPTEAEWEYAARAGTTTAFNTGHCITTAQANYNGTSDYAGCGAKTGVYLSKTQPVGSYAANRWGLSDMHGNVWEWVQDCWHDSYTGAPKDGSEWRGSCYASGRRVLRGGSWDYFPRNLRAADRYWYDSGDRYSNLGLRVARTLTP